MLSITKMSSKGQIVIPSEIREKFKINKGNLFIVSENNDSIYLKKIELPKVKSWDVATKPFKEAAKKSKFTKDDLKILIQESKINSLR